MWRAPCKRVFVYFGVFTISRLSEKACSLASSYVDDMHVWCMWGCNFAMPHVLCDLVIYCTYEIEIVERTRAWTRLRWLNACVCERYILTVSFDLHYCAWPPIIRSNFEGRVPDDFGRWRIGYECRVRLILLRSATRCLSFADNNSSLWNAFSQVGRLAFFVWILFLRRNKCIWTCIIPKLAMHGTKSKCMPQFYSGNSMFKLQKTHSVSL